jgi:virginiamycin B lyase
MGEGPSGDFSTRDPYVAQDGKVWFVAQAGNDIAWLDPATGDRHQFEIEDGTNRYNLIVNEDGYVWYVDEPRGQLGRISPATGDVAEWAMPGGEGSRPYALTKDDRDRLWVSETGPEKQLVGFDPASEEFFSVNEVSHNIRHMMFEPEARAMWFGTDANRVGRILTSPPIP